MNFESLKMGFLSYLESKINSNSVSTDTENQAVQTQKQIPDSEISIFLEGIWHILNQRLLNRTLK